MAKRDIPEINAGSMADIAFLLLLFFLVTTTMEKDTAYIRDIPKKVENPPEDIEIEERNILKIEANSANELKVRDFYPEPDGISDIIQKFYTFNEKENDLKSNYPLYSTATLEMCDVEYLKLGGEAQYKLFQEWCNKNGVKYETSSIKMGLGIKRLKIDGIITGFRTSKGKETHYHIEKLKKHYKIGCMIEL